MAVYSGAMEIAINNNNPREQARQLYWQGWRVSSIARELGVKRDTVFSWKKRDKWERASAIERIESALEVDCCRIIALPERTRADDQRLAANLRHMKTTAQIKYYETVGQDKVFNPKLSNKGRKTNQEKNYLAPEHIEKLQEWFNDTLLKWKYQKQWHDAKKHSIRNILKSRQIGATFYFAHEALMDAVLTGDNQIFMSASKMQSHIFREYYRDTVKDVCDIDLKGEHIKLWNKATLYHLATNKRTGQGFHGHLYQDEYFWIYGFSEFQRVTSGMAMHKKWRETYFSTPSTMTHEAYPFWSGDHFNEGRPKSDHIELNLSHKILKNGKSCQDGHWRHMVTIEDAMAGGCDLFPDIDTLRRKYAPATFDNLLMCKFIDDTASVFSFDEVRKGMVDSWVDWADDFTPLANKPYSNRPVWCGYDPSRSRDDAAFVVIAPPLATGGKFRLLETHTWSDMPYEDQAQEVFKILKRFNVEYLGVDTSGLGRGVFELILNKYPNATPIVYGIETKNRLILKAQGIFRQRRFEFDTSLHDVVSAFTSIKKVMVGKQTTYASGRSQATGHADIAWAIMHAFDNQELTQVFEGMDGINTQKGFIEIHSA